MGKFLTVEMFEAWRKEQLGMYNVISTKSFDQTPLSYDAEVERLRFENEIAAPAPAPDPDLTWTAHNLMSWDDLAETTPADAIQADF